MTSIVCFADLHGRLPEIPQGLRKPDTIVVLAGDICKNYVENFTPGIKSGGKFTPTSWNSFWNFRQIDTQREAVCQLNEINSHLFPHLINNGIDPQNVIWVNGNHDFCDASLYFPNSIYRGSRTLNLGGIRFGLLTGVYPLVGEWWDEVEESEISKRIRDISPDIDILVSHSPTYGINDVDTDDRHLGSQSIYEAIFLREPHFRNLKHHISGHVHHNYQPKTFQIDGRSVKFYNCSKNRFVIDY